MKTPNKRVARFYTGSSIYKGWVYLNVNNYSSYIKNWIRSGNYIKVKSLHNLDYIFINHKDKVLLQLIGY